ncbi:hypothetical protein BDW62DRAFT_186543 [Aspergillus aurantiobrunneus]
MIASMRMAIVLANLSKAGSGDSISHTLDKGLHRQTPVQHRRPPEQSILLTNTLTSSKDPRMSIRQTIECET